MMDAGERQSLGRFMPYLDGNPRRLKRIINVYNVSRRIVELRHGNDWPELTDLKPKLLKFAILLEQWPYRATRKAGAFLPQLLLEEVGLLSSSDAVEDGKALLSLPAILVYKKVVQGLIYSPADCRKWLDLDADAQDFERLLLEEPTFTVGELGLGSDEASSNDPLRSYAFNLPQGIIQRVARSFDELALRAGTPPSQAGRDEATEAHPAAPSAGPSGPTPVAFARKRSLLNFLLRSESR